MSDYDEWCRPERRDILHVVERVEKRVDKPRRHPDKLRQFRLERIVVMLIIPRSKLKVLLDLYFSLDVPPAVMDYDAP